MSKIYTDLAEKRAFRAKCDVYFMQDFLDFAEHAQFCKICPVSAYPNNTPENVISDTLMNM